MSNFFKLPIFSKSIFDQCWQVIYNIIIRKPLNIYLSDKAMAPHSSTLAWKIPWTEESDGLQLMGSLRVRHNWGTSLSLFTFTHWRKKWQPHSSVLAWRIPGTGEPGGLPSMGSHRVGHDWSDLAANMVNRNFIYWGFLNTFTLWKIIKELLLT